MGTLRDRVLTRERLTAAHYLAYRWVLDNLPAPPAHVLDFGCRYSVLPALLADAGHMVRAVDRYPSVVADQDRVARELGVDRIWNVRNVDGERLRLPFGGYDAVCAVWCLQHNRPAETQTDIALDLARLVGRGGQLLVVSSFSTWATVEDTARADPQIKLNAADHERLIIGPCREAGLTLAKLSHFRYTHGCTDGDFCGEEEANAICYQLERKSTT